jgi:hypothetical protein
MGQSTQLEGVEGDLQIGTRAQRKHSTAVGGHIHPLLAQLALDGIEHRL